MPQDDVDDHLDENLLECGTRWTRWSSWWELVFSDGKMLIWQLVILLGDLFISPFSDTYARLSIV